MEVSVYNSTFFNELKSLMEEEGWEQKNMAFDRDTTLIFKNEKEITGFLTYKIISTAKRFAPYLVHFYVSKEYRDGVLARQMLKLFKDVIKRAGYKRFLVNIINTNKKQQRFLRIFFKEEPYTKSEDFSSFEIYI